MFEFSLVVPNQASNDESSLYGLRLYRTRTID